MPADEEGGEKVGEEDGEEAAFGWQAESYSCREVELSYAACSMAMASLMSCEGSDSEIFDIISYRSTDERSDFHAEEVMAAD